MSFRTDKCLSIDELLSEVIRWDVLMGDFPLLCPQVPSSIGLLVVPERAPHQFSPAASVQGASCEEGRISDLAPPKLKSCPPPQTSPPPVSTSKVMTSAPVLFLKVLVSFLTLLSLPHSTPEPLGRAIGSTFAEGQSPVFSVLRPPPTNFPVRAANASPPVLQPARSLCFSPPPCVPLPLHSQLSPSTWRSDAFKSEVRACQFLLKTLQ